MARITPNLKSLPYIEIPTTKGPIKMLVDSGANVNVISERWAFSSGIQIETIKEQNLRGVTGNQIVNKCIKLNLFRPLLNKSNTFLIMNFHPFFDGILGTEILFGTEFNFTSAERSFEVQCDSGKRKIIPLKFYTPIPSVRQSVNNQTMWKTPTKSIRKSVYPT